MQAIVYLCNKSIEIRQKKKNREEEECEEVKETGAIYDEDDEDQNLFVGEDECLSDGDEWELEDDDDIDNDLYDTKLDQMDEILYVQGLLSSLEIENNQHWNYLLSLLDDNERNTLLQCFSIAD